MIGTRLQRPYILQGGIGEAPTTEPVRVVIEHGGCQFQLAGDAGRGHGPGGDDLGFEGRSRSGRSLLSIADRPAMLAPCGSTTRRHEGGSGKGATSRSCHGIRCLVGRFGGAGDFLFEPLGIGRMRDRQRFQFGGVHLSPLLPP